MTAPMQSAPGFVQLPGGYVPNPPAGVNMPQFAPPLPPGLSQPQPQAQPQAQPQQPPAAPVDPRTQFVQPGPAGAPVDSAPPPSPTAPQPPNGQGAPAAPTGLPPAGVRLDARLQGDGVPSELQGRSLAEVLYMYDRMRGIVLDRAAQPQAPQPIQPQAQPQAQPQGQPPQQQQGWDWRNPQDSIARVVNEQLRPLQQALQPVLQQTSQSAVKNARDSVANEVGAATFARLEPLVMQRLAGADPQALQNPQMWRLALQTVVGEMALQGQAPQLAPQAPTQPNQWVQPVQAMPFAGGQPVPNFNSFWTEQPTHGAPPTAPQLTPTQKWAAEAMGMSVAEYTAWSGGIPTGGQR